MGILDADQATKLSFLEQLRQAKSNILPLDPWFPLLKKMAGKVGNDGVNRLTTEAIFDCLDLPLVLRTADAGRRIKTIMVSLGWTPVRTRDVTTRGRAERVRGYARMT